MGNLVSTSFPNDIIVVRQPDGTLCSSPVEVRFPYEEDVANWTEEIVTVSINRKFLETKFSLYELKNEGYSGFASSFLEKLQLRHDLNDITFTTRLHGEDVQVNARMFLWCWDSRIVVVDVDGTITKSDFRGMIFNSLGFDWAHDGVCNLFSAIHKNGYKVIYLSGRPRYWEKATRNLLDGIEQMSKWHAEHRHFKEIDVQSADMLFQEVLKDGERLPKGAVFVSPDGFRAAVGREVSDRQDVDFKIPMLEQIWKLFPLGKGVNPFHAGMGNRPSDERTYLELNIHCKRIFQVDPSEGGIALSCKGKTVAVFPSYYDYVSEFFEEYFPQVQDWAAPQHLSTSTPQRGRPYELVSSQTMDPVVSTFRFNLEMTICSYTTTRSHTSTPQHLNTTTRSTIRTSFVSYNGPSSLDFPF